MRKFLPEREQREQESERRLRINRPAGIYARRSDPEAKDRNKDKSQSREMQTDDLIKWAIKQGWTQELLYEYFADLGLSGTLRPDQRPDMLRLYDDIDTGKYDNGTIICFQENRLFRDEIQIYYNQFIDKCLQHNIHVVVISPCLTIYDLRDDVLKEMLRARLKEAAEFIPYQIKGWLHPARERAAWVDGEWAGIGDISIGYIVDFDEKSPTYKKFIPYAPHRFAIEYLFRRYRELGGDISLLYREVGEKSLVLPFFEEWVDPRVISKFSKVSRCANGYIINNHTIIRGILTNPMYRGYRAIKGVIRRDGNGEIVLDHEPLVNPELFDFAYYRLAKTDFDGNPLDNGRKTHRYFQRGSDAEYGLLKFHIRWSGGQVYTRPVGEYEEDSPTNKAVYRYDPAGEHNYLVSHSCVEIDTEELDALIVARLLEHIHMLYLEKVHITHYNETACIVREERHRRLTQITDSINDIEVAQKNLTRRLGGANERMYVLLEGEINKLEEERLQLLKVKSKLEQEAANDSGKIEDDLVRLEEKWPDYTFARRRAVLNFLIKEVVVDAMSTHWIRVQVIWLHEVWGSEQMYFQRTKGRNSIWTEDEIAILKAYYPTAPKWEVMRMLPERGWFGITGRAKILGIGREKGRISFEARAAARECLMPFPGDKVSSYSDLMFLYEHGLEPKLQRTNWECLS